MEISLAPQKSSTLGFPELGVIAALVEKTFGHFRHFDSDGFFPPKFLLG